MASTRAGELERFYEKALPLAGDLPLYVISEFPPPKGTWIPFRHYWPDSLNWERAQADLADKDIRLVCVMHQPKTPVLDGMRRLAFRLSPLRQVYFNENLDHFMLRPRSLGAIARHWRWRTGSWFTFQFNPGGWIYTWIWRIFHPHALVRPWIYWRLKRKRLAAFQPPKTVSVPEPAPGIAVVIPSRNGRELLERSLPLVLAQGPDQVVVVDNGSDDGTVEWLPEGVEAVVSKEPLSFAAAVNRGVERVRFSHVCLLNNDMEIEPGFLAELRTAFEEIPGLFCSTAQILFPPDKRREETGKAVLQTGDPFAFPVRCDEPVQGENYSPVLYGSGGCSMYCTRRLREIGGFDESFTPAYVEDLDVGLRGGQTVYADRARTLHRHRSTTARYFTPEEIESAIERNLLRAVAKNGLGDLWRITIERLNRRQNLDALRFARTLEPVRGAKVSPWASGDIFRFPGRLRRGKPVIAVASCYAPFPLSHGGAVRMYNLMRRAARDYDQVLVYFADTPATPPDELLDLCAETIVVKRHGTHVYPRLDLPDVVQEFASDAFRGAIDLAVERWRPFALQLEFTQLAQYRRKDVPSILVEHDVTIDLYEQLATRAEAGERWELERQLRLWREFEERAWRECERIVVMSERDRRRVGNWAVVIPNGVDTVRYQLSPEPPERGRILFIGSFAHLPNVLAVKWFVENALPKLDGAKLHIIAGARPEYYLDFYRGRAPLDLAKPDIELEAFVADVRPAYRRAQAVIAPLRASAGTNIKVLEAMAMGKTIVSTAAGIHGLDVADGVLVADDPDAFAASVRCAMEGRDLGKEARRIAVERYDWDAIAERQRDLYESLRRATAE
ncbi:MAG: glycosyltransferase [Bryobacteraceae bacterium]|nr:glycosyltransferase [Bryobacteraceae bacterium]